MPDSPMDEALRRYRTIRPFLYDSVSLSEIARRSGVPLRTLTRWTERYRRYGMVGLSRRSRADKGGHRLLPPADQQLIEALALEEPRRSVAAICRTIGSLPEAGPGKVPGYTTVGRIVSAIDPALLSLAHEGNKAYSEEYDLLYRRQADAPNAMWQGPTMLDLLLLTVVQPRRVQQDGIRFHGFRYIDPVLAAYVGEWVAIRYDPRDMAEIRIFYRNTFLCRAVCQELAGETVSLREIIGARRKRTRQLRQVLKERHALYGQTFPPVHVRHQMPEVHPLESQPPTQTPAPSSLKYYGCD